MKKTTLNKDLSHNLYSDDISKPVTEQTPYTEYVDLKEATAIKFKIPEYLIIIKRIKKGENNSEICWADNITTALNIAILNNNCAIYRLNGTMGKSFKHYLHYFNTVKDE